MEKAVRVLQLWLSTWGSSWCPSLVQAWSAWDVPNKAAVDSVDSVTGLPFSTYGFQTKGVLQLHSQENQKPAWKHKQPGILYANSVSCQQSQIQQMDLPRFLRTRLKQTPITCRAAKFWARLKDDLAATDAPFSCARCKTLCRSRKDLAREQAATMLATILTHAAKVASDMKAQ